MKKILIALVSIIIMVPLLVATWLFFNQDMVKQKAIEAVNQKINTEIAVNGPVDITFLKTFPQVSLSLTDVFIADKLQTGDTLAQLKTTYVSFNLLSILKKNYTIQAITLKGGQVNLFVDQNGLTNYDIIEPSKTNDSSTLLLDLNQIDLIDVAVRYHNLKDKVQIISDVNQAKLSVQLNNKDVKLNTKLDAFMKQFNINNQALLSQHNVLGEIVLNYSNAESCYHLNNNKISINSNEFTVNGSYCQPNNELNFTAKASGSQLKKALALIPKDMLPIGDIDGNGNYEIDAKIYGQASNPTLQIDFGLKDGTANIPNKAIALNNLTLNGSYNNQNKAGDQLKIEQFSFNTNGSQLAGSLYFPNLQQKIIEIDGANGILNHELINAFTAEQFPVTSGSINFSQMDIHLSHRESDSTWHFSKLNGDLGIDDLKGQILSINQDFHLSGLLNVTGNQLTANQFKAVLGKNDLVYTGTLKNYLNYLQADIYGQKSTLSMSGTLTSSYFNIDDFLKEEQAQNATSSTTNGKENNLEDWLQLAGSLNVQIKELRYMDLMLSDMQFTIQPEPQGRIVASNVKAKGLDGRLSGNIQLYFTPEKDLELSLNTFVEQIDISKLFAAFRNFDQTSLTDKNLKGTIDAKIILSATFEQLNNLKEDDLIVQADVAISDGELIELASLQSLSKYLSVEQLSHLYFTNLSATVTIRDKKIMLPETKIASNLMSLQVSGTHYFNDHIDYAIKLNLKNVLAAKWRKNKTQNENYVNDVMGGVDLFISMTGTVDDPIIKYDKQSVKETIKSDFKNEKEELKNLFQKNTFEPVKGEDYLYFEEDTTEFMDWE